jgi:hypothetical protein
VVKYVQVKDRTWLVIREEGMVVEEAAEGSDDSNGDHEETYDEKGALVKEVSLQLQADLSLEITDSNQNGEKHGSNWPARGRDTNILHNT